MLAHLDMRTLSVAAGLVSLFCCFPMIYMLSSRKAYPGMGKWAAATLGSFMGLVLLGLRDTVPDILSVVAANTLIVAYAVLSTQGLLEFVGKKSPVLWDSLITAGMAITLGLFALVWPNYVARVVAICAVYTFYTLRSLIVIWKDFPALSIKRNWLLVVAFALSAVWYVARAVFTLVLGRSSSNLEGTYAFQTASLILALAAVISVVSGFVIANLQRVRTDLDHAQMEVKTLSGLLPVCSNCHKIHDDDGRWVNIELYVSRHSEASFSHGLCNDCAAKLYPDLYYDHTLNDEK